jgi:hypothetical protein
MSLKRKATTTGRVNSQAHRHAAMRNAARELDAWNFGCSTLHPFENVHHVRGNKAALRNGDRH